MTGQILTSLLLFLPLTMAQAAGSNTTCTWDVPTQMGSGGGILMFFLGFMVGALVIGIIWLLMDQRWRSWHIMGRKDGPPAPQYAPLYPSPDPSQPQGYPPQPQGYPGLPQGYPPQQGGAWGVQFGLGNYRTEYELINPLY
jgi:hypothetical protein